MFGRKSRNSIEDFVSVRNLAKHVFKNEGTFHSLTKNSHSNVRVTVPCIIWCGALHSLLFYKYVVKRTISDETLS